MESRAETRLNRRRANLARCRDTRFSSNIAMAEALGDDFSPSYVSQLINGHRGIGDKIADKIEERLNLPNGYLDTPVTREMMPAQAKLWEQIVWMWNNSDDETMTLFRMMVNLVYNKKKAETEARELLDNRPIRLIKGGAHENDNRDR